MPEIVLVHPEIPANTGNIARSCVATGTRLHLVEPLGFSLSERQLRRAGLDYWPRLDLVVWPDLDHWLAASAGRPLWLCTTHAGRSAYEVQYEPDALLVFGCETSGLPEGIKWRIRAADPHPDAPW